MRIPVVFKYCTCISLRFVGTRTQVDNFIVILRLYLIQIRFIARDYVIQIFIVRDCAYSNCSPSEIMLYANLIDRTVLVRAVYLLRTEHKQAPLVVSVFRVARTARILIGFLAGKAQGRSLSGTSRGCPTKVSQRPAIFAVFRGTKKVPQLCGKPWQPPQLCESARRVAFELSRSE